MTKALNAFKNLLAEVNKELGANLADCPEQHGTEFTYRWDGLMDCSLVFNRSGSVTEFIEGQSMNYTNILAWAQALIKSMGEK